MAYPPDAPVTNAKRPLISLSTVTGPEDCTDVCTFSRVDMVEVEVEKCCCILASLVEVDSELI